MNDAGRRVIVVLGYSEPGCAGLHPVCAQRLAHAATIATDNDVVVLSGWARVPGTPAEADLMAEAWDGSARQVVVDPDAASTVENARHAVDDVIRSGADTVVVVTSRWHARRAAVAFRWCLRRTGATIVSTAPPGGSLADWVRDIPGWLALPVQLAFDWPRSRRHHRDRSSDS